MVKTTMGQSFEVQLTRANKSVKAQTTHTTNTNTAETASSDENKEHHTSLLCLKKKGNREVTRDAGRRSAMPRSRMVGAGASTRDPAAA